MASSMHEVCVRLMRTVLVMKIRMLICHIHASVWNSTRFVQLARLIAVMLQTVYARWDTAQIHRVAKYNSGASLGNFRAVFDAWPRVA